MNQAAWDEWVLLLASGKWKETNGFTEKLRYPFPQQWRTPDRRINFPLPAIGAFWERANTESSGTLREDVLRTFTARFREFPRGSAEQAEALRVLTALEQDYQLMKAKLEGVDRDPMYDELRKQGYDIVPDLTTGRYVWVQSLTPDKTLKCVMCSQPSCLGDRVTMQSFCSETCFANKLTFK